jgi:two-component system sensor histidine kinase UhpB
VFLVTMWLISRSLTPIRRLSDALAQLRDGDYSVRLARTGPPEFTQISEKLNALASTLQSVTGANQRLVQKLIHVQDEERKEIARDLHDEMGPYLFAMRAATKSLVTQAKIPQANPARIAMACELLEEHAASLQQLNRTMLNRLRPTALRELGLEEALGALVAQVRTDHPELRISFSAPESFSDVDETTALTIYRIVQEGLTNVVKHARAKHVRIVISNERDWLRIRIEDDGSGLSADQVSGLGLLGMRERLQALDGNLDLRAGASGGTILEARLPRVRAATLA